jgi:hypothetical protein
MTAASDCGLITNSASVSTSNGGSDSSSDSTDVECT